MHEKMYIPIFSIVAVTFYYNWDTIIPLTIYIIWLSVLVFRKKVSLLFLLICLIILILSFVRFPEINSINNFSKLNESVRIKGTVSSEIKENNQRLSFIIKTENNERVQVSLFKDENAMKKINNLQLLAFCHIKGKLIEPNAATNPHEFDYSTYLKQQNISQQLNIKDSQDIQCSENNQLMSFFNVRSHLIQNTSDKFKSNTASWINSLVLGEDAGLEEDIIDLFRRWGIGHLLAISGLHVSIIIALIFYILLLSGLLTKEKINLFLIIFLIFYAWLAGGQPSVLRASLMVIIGLIYIRQKNRLAISDIISMAFIILFFISPYLIYHVGFQLSFAVTFSIILSQKWLSSSPNLFYTLFNISFISQMAIIPLQIHYFSIFNPLSIILNIIIVPYFSFVVIPYMFILLLLSFLPVIFLNILSFPFEMIHALIMDLLFKIDKYLYFPYILKSLQGYEIIIYYILLVAFMQVLEKQKLKCKNFIIICFTLFIPFLALKPYLNPNGTVTVLDIGQGDAIVIELPFRESVFMIDAGAIPRFNKEKGVEGQAVYQNTIKPFLYGEGIMHIDSIFISHDDYDHYGSVDYIAEDFVVDNIFISQYFDRSVLSLNNTNIYLLKRGDKVNISKHTLHILHPDKNMGNENDNSLVIAIEMGGVNWLFTGDISRHVEESILTNYPNLSIDILKVAHHGSDTSTSEKLANRVRNSAIISVGRKNRYGHPNVEVLDTLNENNINILRTDQDGAIQYKFRKNKLSKETFKRK